MDETLLSRIEDAGINASAPPQQLWLDGWIVRTSPGKAKRARCINAVAAGRMRLDHKLRLCADVYARAGLPMVVRITRFTQPPGLEAELERRGFASIDDTRVMVNPALTPRPAPAPPAGLDWETVPGPALAEIVGELRGSPPEQRAAQAQRLAASPVPFQGFVLRRRDDGQVLACGQVAREAELVGLYDVYTREDARGQGLARLLCERMLSISAAHGATVAYLQTEADNTAARRIYHALGFADAYAYRYRQAPS